MGTGIWSVAAESNSVTVAASGFGMRAPSWFRLGGGHEAGMREQLGQFEPDNVRQCLAVKSHHRVWVYVYYE
jgi:hypothetical protein